MLVALGKINVTSLSKNSGRMPEPRSSLDSTASEDAHIPHDSNKLGLPRATAVPVDTLAPEGKVIDAETDSLLYQDLMR